VDDIPEELQHAADKQVYHSLAHAHADLANRLNHWLKERDAKSWLIVCPTFYHNLGEPPYVKELGERTEAGISIMWTGAKVVSRTITHEDAELFKLAIRRKPFVWDNYPVNDLRDQPPADGTHHGARRRNAQALRGAGLEPDESGGGVEGRAGHLR
jgi:hyaluronoglucosaminidase